MRVRKAYIPAPPWKEIQPVGLDAQLTGVPNVKPAVRYIRPDGNADQYRKGAF